MDFFETESRLPVNLGKRKQSKFAPNAWELSIIVASPDLQKTALVIFRVVIVSRISDKSNPFFSLASTLSENQNFPNIITQQIFETHAFLAAQII